MRWRRLIPLLALGALLPVWGPAWGEDILVVANPSVALAHPLAPAEVAAIYLLRTTVWPDGGVIIPVNREIGSGLRALFTADVLHRDNASLVAYWNEMHFRGRLPPVVQESEQALLAFIRRVPGAIGYVAGGRVPDGVVVVARIPLPAHGGAAAMPGTGQGQMGQGQVGQEPGGLP